jgi:hypothetical protein
VLGSSGTLEDECGFGPPADLIGTVAEPVNPNLGTLVDNGGPTRTQAPNPGSPAIDRGGTCPETDQRGFFRAPAAPCDAGAVEVGATVTPPVVPVQVPPGGTSPPAGAGAAAPSSSAPAVAVSPPSARVAIAGKVRVEGGTHGRLDVLVGIAASCPPGGGACTGTAGVTAAHGHGGRGSSLLRDLGDTGLAIAAGRTEPVSVKLSRAASKALLEAGRLRVRIAVSLTAPATESAVLSRTAILLPPKPSDRRG